MKKSNLTTKDRSVNQITNFSIPVAHAAYESYEAIKDQYKNMPDQEKSSTNNLVKGAAIGAGAGLGAGVISAGIDDVRNVEKAGGYVDKYDKAKKSLEKVFNVPKGTIPNSDSAKPYIKKLAHAKSVMGALSKIPKYTIGGLAAGATIGMLKSNKTNNDRGQYGNDQ